jgi:hypothetical protein
MSRFLRRTWDLLGPDTEGAYAKIVHSRYILVPFLVVCLFEITAGVLTARQQAADSVSAILANPLLSGSPLFNEETAYEIFRPTARRMTMTALWRVFWISVEIATTAIGLVVAGMALGKWPAVWETIAVVTNSRLIPAVVGKLVEVPFAWYLGSVFYAQISLGPLFVDLDSVKPIHHFLFETNLFYVWRTISLAEGMSFLWKMSLRSCLLIAFGIWLLKTSLVTAYVGFAFGNLNR